MRPRGRSWIVLLAVLAPLGSVVAEDGAAASGTLRATGSLELEGDLHGSARIEGLFSGDTSTLRGFVLESARVEVTRFVARYLDVDGPKGRVGARLDLDEATFPLRDVTLTVRGSDPGWLGLAWEGGALTLAGARYVALDPQAEGAIGNEMTDAPDSAPAFRHETKGAALAAALETVAVEGRGAWKFSGPTVDARARENATEWRSGTAAAATPAGTRTVTWYVVRFDQATVRAQGRAPFDTQLASVDLGGVRSLALTYAGGEVETGESVLAGTPGQRAVLEGDLRVNVVPQHGTGALVDLRGDLRASTLGPLASVEAPARAPSWLLLLLGLALAGGAAAAVGRRRAARRTAEELVVLADAAAEQGDFEEAVRLTAEARRVAPTSARLAFDEAHYRRLAGDAERALAMFDALATTTADGEADLEAARILGRQGRDEEAAARVARALARTPVLVLEADGDPALVGALRRPEARSAMRAARRAAGDREA